MRDFKVGDELVVTEDYKTWNKGDKFTYYGDSSRDGCAKGYQNGRKLMKFIPYELLKTKEETKLKNTDELKQSKEYSKIGFSWESKPKKVVPTKPYQQLVAYDFNHSGEIIWGVFSHMDGDKVYAHWSNRYPCRKSHYTEFMELDRIIDIVDIIIHDPKEENLSIAQEQANFAHAAVQGIINAHAEKNGESLKKDDPMWNIFTFSDFDSSVRRTWKKQDFKDAVTNAALGLTGEAGEVADLIKKAVYHGRGFDTPKWVTPVTYKRVAKEDVKDELSDVLFYVSAMAQEFGFTLEDVARHNKEKLEKRFPEGFSTEASAQKADRAPEVKPKGIISIKKRDFEGYMTIEDHLEVILEGDSGRDWHTFFKTSKDVDKEIENLKEGESVTIKDEHDCTIKFTKVNGLINIHSIEDLGDVGGKEDFKGECFTLKVTSKEVTN
ncbi:nucleoside triphosphate pyrophosphohydrolase family protein [Bacillus cereus group sp. TH153LC]|uniref:nucleoside triphosphate pyrophosphohydrolase family protein n=1 Tax=Bacillus cereus group sp. TH153LC TaxID=3018059 RepID=UPI0022E67B85|nr:nucleoside triphosphate pyrophosphohydrolase family protein [Bacillus cereus group sp. TH153LC]MDA1658852.1 nucleoside triphosphate pyrophosphohydrolase family protein [Bacillus cereus group sp. TH153LC]